MLITPTNKITWLVASLAAAVAVIAGIAVAASVGPSRLSEPTGVVGLVAQPDPECDDPNDPACSIGDHQPGEDPPPNIPGNPGGGGACTWTRSTVITVSLAAQDTETIEIPCVHPEYGWWDGDHCYWSSDYPFPYEPPDEIPDGRSAEDGQWYFGTCIFDAYYEGGELVLIIQAALFNQWFDNADVPVVTPAQVAQDWLATVDLYGVEFQLAPPETGTALVSLPVWLGVAETEDTWGPISDRHCIADVCVSIAAEVSEVEWTMGDGQSETCTRNQHVAWQRGMTYLAPGDSCHHYYERSSRNQPDGKYQITATSTWAVHWEAEASDAEDDLTTTREATAALQVDEIQVLTR